LRITIRKELPGDAPAIRLVNVEAFGQNDEADIVDALRQNCDDLLSLVAVEGSEILGHALWSPVTVESGAVISKGMGLGPVAVLKEFQRKGIGTRLINEGIELLRSRECPFVIVLGHPEYYPRFGFVPASRQGIKSEWDMPDNAFMVLLLDPSRAEEIHGVAKYRPEFSMVR
jgi:putative acetyltransferase